MTQPSIYSYFGLKPSFVVDTERLEAAYLAAIKKVHPDLFAARPAAERRVAEQWSTRLNEAYQNIKDPVRRATYLCEVAGFDVGAEKNTAMPMDFLMAQMRWREMLDNAPEDEKVKETLNYEVKEEEERILADLTEALDVKQDYQAAVALTRKLMFVTKFHSQLQQKEQH